MVEGAEDGVAAPQSWLRRLEPIDRGALAAVAAVCALVLWRVMATGIQGYGSDGAEFIELAALADVGQQVRDRSGWSWAFLQRLDGAFPPGLHLVTLPWAWLADWDQRAVAATGIGWLLLLCVAAAGIARRIEPSSGPLAAAVVALTPALHGAATRYYYDLPMVALLWAAGALLLARRPVPTAPAVIGLVLLATWVKWTSIAMAPLVLGAAAVAGGLRLRQDRLATRLVVVAVASAAAAALLRGYLGDAGPETSFGLQAGILDQQDPLLAGLAPGEAGPGRVSRALARVGHWSGGDLLFLALRPVASVLGLGLTALWAVAVWSAPRLARLLAGLAAAGTLCFLLGFVPVLDDRFWLPALPAVAVCVATGARRRPRLAVAILAVGLVVGVEFHLSPPAPWNTSALALAGGGAPQAPGDSSGEVEFGGDYKGRPQVVFRGLAAASSVEDRGWTRGDEQPPPRSQLREAVWRAVAAQAPTCLGLPWEQAALGERGDFAWWQWAARREHLRQGPDSAPPPTLTGVCGGGLPRRCSPDLLALPRGAHASSAMLECAGGEWARSRVADPAGGTAYWLGVPAAP